MPETSQARAMTFGVKPNQYMENVNRWAIIIGISKYKHDGLDLKYAHNDANELYDLIRTPSGGAFDEKRIQKFINEKATTANVTRALRSFLQKPAAEDIVLIYFACHGAPDPQRPEVVYLLTHDTDPEDIPGTALPMREIDLALKENLHAERVVIIADSCHSAAVGGKIGRRGIGDSAVINRYLQDLSESKAGLALLTSAQANESSLESEQWGGGHGVFTHFLLEGMRGKADRNRDGTVSVGELFEYVRDEVKRATNDAQHPVIGPNPFDAKLPLAITGGISAEEHLRLGICLNQLGRLLNEPSRFEFARLQLQEAILIAERFREKLPEAQLQIGLAEMALGDYKAAVDTLQRAIKDDREETLPEVHLHLGMTLARLGKLKQAATSLKKFLKLRPEDARAQFVQRVISRLCRVHVLLIGIGNYKMQYMRLPGPANDIRMMKHLLVSHYGIVENGIRTLIDAEATQRSIMAELDRLQREAKPEDEVLVYFSGHAFQGDEAEHYLIPYDFDGDKAQSVTAQQLHESLNGIRSRVTTMIIDSHATRKFVELAKQEAHYRLLLGTSPELQAYESPTDDGLPVGRFTDALVKQLTQNPANVPLDRILGVVANNLATQPEPQEPVFVGEMSEGLLRDSNRLKDTIEAFEFSLRRNYDALSLNEVRNAYSMMRVNENSFLQLDLSYSRAFLEKGLCSEALALLKPHTSDYAYVGQAPETMLLLGIAQLHNQDYKAALKSLKEYADHKADAAKQMDAPLRTMSRLKDQRKHAILVGIDQYRTDDVPPLRGAVNDVQLVKKVLINSCSFANEDIQLITDSQATHGAIVAAFEELFQKAQHEPALFYFAGYGSLDQNGEPTIVPVDRGAVSYPNDILLRDLADKTKRAATNLVTIIDAGWQENVRPPYGDTWGSRFAPPQLDDRPLTRGLAYGSKRKAPRKSDPVWQPDPAWSQDRERVEQRIADLKIGRLSVYHVSIQYALDSQRGKGGEPIAEAEFPDVSGSGKQIHGVLTHALMEVFREENSSDLTYDALIAAAAERLKWVQPFVVGDNTAEVLFSAPVQEQEVHDLVYTRIRQEPIRQAIQLLSRLIEQAGGTHALANLNLGVAHAALREFSESRIALEKAIAESGKDPIPEAHYYLGRVLYEMDEELDRAVSELRKALEEDPQNVPANYFFGHAVRKRTEQKTLVEATKAFEFYLNNGAPLGQRGEVEEVLRRWSDRGTGTGS